MTGSHRFDEDLLDSLPLPLSSFFVLFALTEGEKHGYRIMQDIRKLSEGSFSLGPATLYTTIKRLTERSLVSEISNSTESRRRTYVLTSAGKRLLGAEFHRQQALLDLARSRGLLKYGGRK